MLFTDGMSASRKDILRRVVVWNVRAVRYLQQKKSARLKLNYNREINHVC